MTKSRCLLSGSVLMAALTGCQTTDFDADVHQAAAEVARRSGREPRWSAPWADRVPQWDGRSALTLEQALTIALENNRQIRSDVYTIGVARADFVQAGLLPNPVLSVVHRFPVGDVAPVTAVSLLQALGDLWRRPARIDAADAALQEATLRVSAGALELEAKIKQSYARIAHAKATLRLIDENARLLDQSRQLARAKFEAATGTRLDVNRVEAEQLGNDLERDTARTELMDEKLTLLELMGLAGAATDWDAEEPGEPAPLTIDEKKVMMMAGTQRLDVLAVTWSYQSQAHKLRDAQLGSVSQVSAGLDFEKSDPGGSSIGPTLEFDVPIFDQGQAKVAGARAELARIGAAAAAVKQQAIREVRQAYVDYAAARRQFTLVRERIVPLQQHNLELAKAAFTGGIEDLTSLLEVQRSLNDTKIKLESLKRDLLLKQAELERAAGGSLMLKDAVASAHPPANAH